MKENRFGSRVSTIGLIRGRVLVGALLSLAILVPVLGRRIQVTRRD
ncbi:MAG: hypothetical protein WCH75_10940 [Candidatus Binatia bacterium]